MVASGEHERPILCLNSGSSSLKFALYRIAETGEVLAAEGAVEGIGLPEGSFWLKAPGKEAPPLDRRRFSGHKQAAETVFAALEALHLPPPAAVGHRLVHGGPDFNAPRLVDDALLDSLRRLEPLAPLHIPGALQTIEALQARISGLPQVVCFDTAFHLAMPEQARRLPLSHQLWREGVRRYGFHGLSYEYIMDALGVAAPSRIIIAHLGNGASLAAVRDGRPQDTTMGFTPSGGLMMGTRSGDLDPGVLLYLMRGHGIDAAGIDELVNRQGGLLGVSEISPDMKTLLDKRASEPGAARAVELFCYLVRKNIGALAAVLGGLDMLVFTGGIGERAAEVRREVCAGLEHLGIRIDRKRNGRHADPISFPGSPCAVRVIPTNEDLMIARHTRALVAAIF